MFMGLLDFQNPSSRLSSKEMLDCINLIIKSSYHIPVHTDVKGEKSQKMSIVIINNHNWLSIMKHTCNPSMWKPETGGQLRLEHEFQESLCSHYTYRTSPCPKTTQIVNMCTHIRLQDNK